MCVVLLMLVMGFSTAFAEEGTSGKSPSRDPSGTWNWERTFNDNKAEFTLKLNWDGKRLAGKYSAFNRTTDIEDAKLEKDQISFLAKREFNGNKFEVKFNGKVEPENLVGKITVDFGNGPQDFDWNAKRSVSADDVVGVWDLRVESPGGAVTPRLTITKTSEDKLQGSSESVMGKFEAKNIELKDNTLTWQVIGEGPNGKIDIRYKGKPRGNTIEGENEFDFGGTKGKMKFTGTRTPPEGKKEARKPADKEEAASRSADENKREP
jgi:hypothetical protein